MPATANPNEGAWDRVNRVFEGADTIDQLTRLYREGGLTSEEAFAKAVHVWNEHKTQLCGLPVPNCPVRPQPDRLPSGFAANLPPWQSFRPILARFVASWFLESLRRAANPPGGAAHAELAQDRLRHFRLHRSDADPAQAPALGDASARIL